MLCIGLDLVNKPVEDYKKLIDITKDYCDFYKLNPAFFNDPNIVLEVVEYLNCLKLQWIYDGKIGDVMHTNKHYANYIYRVLNASGVTLNPFVGFDALAPFIEHENKYNFILCKTSNSGSKLIQDFAWQSISTFAYVSNSGLVVAGNNVSFLKQIRDINPRSPILAPGIGAQGGIIEEPIPNVIYSVSRSIINAENPGSVAMKYRQNIQGQARA